MFKRILLILALGAAGGAVTEAGKLATNNPTLDTLIAVGVTAAAAAINTKKDKTKNPPKED